MSNDREQTAGGATDTVRVSRLKEGEWSEVEDFLAREEPLEIRVEGKSVAVTMRTPGHDRELAAGFLLGEGIVKEVGEVFEIAQCPALEGEEESVGNGVDVLLTKGVEVDFQRLTRHVFSTSSCGICGKASMDGVFQNFPAVEAEWRARADLIAGLPERLRVVQRTFAQTGGLHACALFDRDGGLLVVREDVGRHNALDKVLGWALLEGRLPLSECILLLSGRVSFELMQKALAGGIPVVVAISAPSSLAVDFGRRSGQTVVGFLRGEKMNVYCGGERIGRLT